MPELPLHREQVDALTPQVDRVPVAELMRGAPLPHPRARRELPERSSDVGAGPGARAGGRARDDAEDGAGREVAALVEPRADAGPAPRVTGRRTDGLFAGAE